MIKLILSGIRKFFLGVTGVAGGGVCGCIVLLLLVHLQMVLGFELPSILVLFAIVVSSFALVGLLAPRFFGMFVLCPLSWLLSPDDLGGGHPSGNDASMPEFLYNASYMIGLALLVAGVFFTLPWLVACGVLGITVFTVGVGRQLNNEANRVGGRF